MLDLKTGKDDLTLRSPAPQITENEANDTDIAFSPDGSRLAVNCWTKAIHVFDAGGAAPSRGARVVAERRPAPGRMGSRSERRMDRPGPAAAGLTPWPKLFHNLRASRETERAAVYPLHVVCTGIGNSTLIAQKHYLQTTEEDFRRAAKSGAGAVQNPVQQEAGLICTEPQG